MGISPWNLEYMFAKSSGEAILVFGKIFCDIRILSNAIEIFLQKQNFFVWRFLLTLLFYGWFCFLFHTFNAYEIPYDFDKN